jgi:hypothetical protein
VTEAKGLFLDSAVAVLLSRLIDGWKKGKERMLQEKSEKSEL